MNQAKSCQPETDSAGIHETAREAESDDRSDLKSYQVIESLAKKLRQNA